MQTFLPLTRLMAAGAMAVALALTACSEEVTAPGGTTVALSQAEADELGAMVSDDAESFAEASTYDNTTGFDVDFAEVGFSGPPIPGATGVCQPTITPPQPANLDNDRVPDAVLFDYTGFDCTLANVNVQMSGTLGIEDPAIPGFGVRFIFSDLARIVSSTVVDRFRARTWDGTRQIVGSPSNPGSQLTHTITNFKTTFEFANGNSGEHTKNWNGIFDADVAGSIDYGSRLPSGTWSFDGNATWIRNVINTYSVQVATTTPLHYNVDCTLRPRFDGGVIEATVTRNGQTTLVTIEHPACGTTIITRSNVPAT
ncbi:MAG: hypothetical protein E4H37_01300 [Gemmatimonadales bacterium]|nr:MAG: hypothetical protein E4H37_01300 [Gemmatimonadales bacterium]